MTLATHMIIAAAAAKPFAAFHPVISFAIAAASHFLADAIPHWDYRLESMADADDPEKQHLEFSKKKFARDLARLSADGFLGAGIVFLALKPHTATEFFFFSAIVIGGALPDFLEGVYATQAAPFLAPLHAFHNWIHTKIKLGFYPYIGIPFQILIAGIAFWFLL